MASPTKHPATGVYYLRQRTPADLLGKISVDQLPLQIAGEERTFKVGTHVKLSLLTKDRDEARRRFREADTALNDLWATLRAGPQPLSHKRIQALAGLLYHELVEMMDEEPGGEGIWRAALKLNESKRDAGQLDAWFGPTVDALFAKNGVSTDALSRTLVVNAAFNAIQAAGETNLRRAQGDYSPDPNANRYPALEDSAKAPAGVAISETDLFALLDHKHSVKSMKDKTRTDYEGYLTKFAKFARHQDAAKVTTAEVRNWRDELVRNGLSPKTINDKYLAALSGVLTHAVREFGLAANVASNIRDGRKIPSVSRKSFTPEEARQILKATFETPTSGISAPHQRALFWVPWICAYTGLRVSEVAQLQGRDVRQMDAVPYFVVTPEAGSTKSSRAWITGIHPHLIELGVIEMFRAVGDGPAFYTPYPGEVDLTTLSGKLRSKETGVRVGN